MSWCSLPTWRRNSAILGFQDGLKDGFEDGLKDRFFFTAAIPATLNDISAAKEREQKSLATFAGRRSNAGGPALGLGIFADGSKTAVEPTEPTGILGHARGEAKFSARLSCCVKSQSRRAADDVRAFLGAISLIRPSGLNLSAR